MRKPLRWCLQVPSQVKWSVPRIGAPRRDDPAATTSGRAMHNRTRPDDARKEGTAANEFRLEQLEPPLDMALRGLQFTRGKRHRPLMMDRLKNENRIWVAI